MYHIYTALASERKATLLFSIHLLPCFQAPLCGFKFLQYKKETTQGGKVAIYGYVYDALHISLGDISDYFNLLRASVFRWEGAPSVPGCPE